MAQETAGFSDFTEPTILLKPSKLYCRGMSAGGLYDVTRGVWRVDKVRAERAAHACTVVAGEVIEVYTILSWHPANTTPYASGRRDQADKKYADRFEFIGDVAAADVRDKYIGKMVNHFFGRGQVVRYLNC